MPPLYRKKLNNMERAMAEYSKKFELALVEIGGLLNIRFNSTNKNWIDFTKNSKSRCNMKQDIISSINLLKYKKLGTLCVEL